MVFKKTPLAGLSGSNFWGLTKFQNDRVLYQAHLAVQEGHLKSRKNRGYSLQIFNASLYTILPARNCSNKKIGSVSNKMPCIKPKLPKLTTAALKTSSSLMASAPSQLIKSSEATGFDFFSSHTCLSGATTNMQSHNGIMNSAYFKCRAVCSGRGTSCN